MICPIVDGYFKRGGDATLTCVHCGHSRRREVRCWIEGIPVDPFFGLPLWLQAPCCGRTLWAYNGEHLGTLAGYVSAGLREEAQPRAGYTMVEILPRWMKLAKHRREVLRVVDRLRRTLPAPVTGI